MLIGLNGKKQSGKDTVYARLKHLYGEYMPVERASFADLLYMSAARSLGVTVRDLQNWKSDPFVSVCVLDKRPTAEYSIPRPPVRVLQESSIREYLQRYGTEAHRQVFGDNFWVEQVDLQHERKLVVVTDVRFPNEAQCIKRGGGQVVRVVGTPEVEGAKDTHSSETPLPNKLVDFELANEQRDDAFQELDAVIDGLMDRLTHGQLKSGAGI